MSLSSFLEARKQRKQAEQEAVSAQELQAVRDANKAYIEGRRSKGADIVESKELGVIAFRDEENLYKLIDTNNYDIISSEAIFEKPEVIQVPGANNKMQEALLYSQVKHSIYWQIYNEETHKTALKMSEILNRSDIDVFKEASKLALRNKSLQDISRLQLLSRNADGNLSKILPKHVSDIEVYPEISGIKYTSKFNYYKSNGYSGGHPAHVRDLSVTDNIILADQNGNYGNPIFPEHEVSKIVVTGNVVNYSFEGKEKGMILNSDTLSKEQNVLREKAQRDLFLLSR